MTYVTDQTPSELRSHMRSLVRLAGWHEPLANRLWKEIQEQDAELIRLREVNAELLEALKAIARETRCSWTNNGTRAYGIAQAAIAKAEVTK